MRSLALVLLTVVACGDDGNVSPLDDAPIAPDAPDAPTTGLVTLTVLGGTTPQVGVQVYFQNADSSLVSATVTDASGVASATMDTGGYVTAVDPFAGVVVDGAPTNLGEIKTFAGVKPNDNLVLRTTGQVSVTNVTVVAPEDPGATSYVMFTSCGTYGLAPSAGSGSPAGGPITLVDCGATIDLVIETSDGKGGVRQSMTANGVAITEGGTIDLSLGAYATAPTTTWMYGNVPATINTISVNGFLATSRGVVVRFGAGTSPDNGTATTGPVAHGVAEDAVQINASRFDRGGISEQTLVDWAAPTAVYSLAMTTATLMPDFATGPDFDVASRSVAWTTGGTNTRAPDLAIAHADFNRIGSQSFTWTWDIAAPHGAATGIALPTLPAPDDQVNAIAGDEVAVSNLLTATLPGGYDAIRANALSFFENPEVAGVVGATGQVVFQEAPILTPAKRTPRGRRIPSRTRR